MYKKIFLITTEDSPQNSVDRKGFVLNEGIQKELIGKESLLLFCYTVKTKKEEGLTESELENSIFNQNKNIKNLNIYCKDGYQNLADKTFQSIKWINKNFDFEYLFKCDDNKYPSETMLKPLGVDFSGCIVTKRRETDEEGKSWWNRNHQEQGLERCKTSKFSKWALTRNIKVNEYFLDSQVYYSTWKPYILSKKFCEVISNHGKNYAEYYCKNLGGCEDHMIGKIAKDLEITFKLTIK